MTPIVFLDTETTSLRPDRKAWEVAMIRRDDDGERETQFYVDVTLEEADPVSLRIGGYYDRHPLGKATSGLGECEEPTFTTGDPLVLGSFLEEVAAARVVAAWTHGAHLVGAVPAFDAEVLARLLRDNWLCPGWHYHLIDVETLAVGWLARKFGEDAKIAAVPDAVAVQMKRAEFEPPWDSETLSLALGVEPPDEDERHTALGDARWAARIYDQVLGA